QVVVVDAVHAQRAFLHHAFDFGVLARAVGAGPRTQLAADALVLVDQHDAVLGALVAGAGRAHRHAGRGFAVQAGTREMQRHRRLRVLPGHRGGRSRRTLRGDFIAVHAVEPHAGRRLAVRLFVGQRP